MLIVPSDETGLADFHSPVPTSVALGRFDGLHLAHKKVIDAAINFPHTLPCVFTFEQSPHGLLTGEMVYSLLTEQQKRDMLEKMGIQLYVCPPFNDVKEMLPEEFVIMLKEQLNVQHISCGFNFSFGKYGKGNAAVLKEICKRYKIKLTVIPPVEADGEPVSSTLIRKYLTDGNIPAANRLLGYNFFINFPVIDGDKRGRTFDYPTINQKLPLTFIHPKYGVYATKTLINGSWYRSVSNVGIHPTVGTDYPRCETNILGFDGDLYGDNIRVEFFKFIRPEREFADIAELTAAIGNDIDTINSLVY